MIHLCPFLGPQVEKDSDEESFAKNALFKRHPDMPGWPEGLSRVTFFGGGGVDDSFCNTRSGITLASSCLGRVIKLWSKLLRQFLHLGHVYIHRYVDVNR
jgi:hypothetical protein